MSADKALRCDCGYRLRARTERCQVAEVRRHAWEAHGISFSIEEALTVLLRLELDHGSLADLAMAEETTPTIRGRPRSISAEPSIPKRARRE